MRHSLVLLLIGILMTACSRPKLHKKLFDGEIVYVRANSAKKGLDAGSFGDVVISNGRGKTRKITNDYYYDSCPNWVDNGKKILFASKRGNDGMGLAKSNYLCLYDFKKNRVNLLNQKIFNVNPNSKGKSLDNPDISKINNYIVFSFFIIINIIYH